jgi:hypothetical protein
VALALALFMSKMLSEVEWYSFLLQAQQKFQECGPIPFLINQTKAAFDVVIGFIYRKHSNKNGAIISTEGSATQVSTFAVDLMKLPVDLHRAVVNLRAIGDYAKFLTGVNVEAALNKALKAIGVIRTSNRLPAPPPNVSEPSELMKSLKLVLENPKKLCTGASNIQKRFVNHLKTQDSSKYGSVGSVTNVLNVLRANAMKQVNAEAVRQYTRLVNQFITNQKNNNVDENMYLSLLGKRREPNTVIATPANGKKRKRNTANATPANKSK